MTGDDDDLRINTLHRFAKHSPRLVLHEYSHCEVPAGCGGVVLRWIDPAQGVPSTLRVSAPAVEATCWLDGALLASNLLLLPEGYRVLAVHLRRIAPRAQPFTIAIHHDADGDEADLIAPGAPEWRCTAAQPRPELPWAAPDFDAAAWGPPPLASPAQIAAQEPWLRRGFEEAATAGRPVLVLETAELWLRVAFLAPGAS
jgi:hypothetical protein